MWALDNSDLPTTALPNNPGGALARLWADGATHLSPLAEIDLVGPYRGSYPIINGSLPETPTSTRSYVRVPLGFTPAKVQNVRMDGTQISRLTPPALSTDGYWMHQSSMSVLIEVGATLTAALDGEMVVPTPVNNVFTIDISTWTDFTATHIHTDGMCLFLAVDSNNPQPLEFTQENGVIKIYASDIASPRAGRKLMIIGTIEKTLSSDTAIVIGFSTAHLGNLRYIDQVRYLNQTYVPTKTRLSPQSGELMFDSRNKMLYLFTSP